MFGFPTTTFSSCGSAFVRARPRTDASSCKTGVALTEGVKYEQNSPNTIDGCNDQSASVYRQIPRKNSSRVKGRRDDDGGDRAQGARHGLGRKDKQHSDVDDLAFFVAPGASLHPSAAHLPADLAAALNLMTERPSLLPSSAVSHAPSSSTGLLSVPS